ncbi:MAG: MBL fold metallo-hydrolase [Gemmatimonadaceae bacterium]
MKSLHALHRLHVAPRLSVAALIGLALLAPVATASAQKEGEPPLRIDVERLRPNIHVVSGYENGNVLVIVADTGVLIVDAQSSKRVAGLDSAIKRLTPQRVRTVVNTHYHADHTEGNGFFHTRGAEIVAQRNIRAQALKDTVIADWNNWHREPLPPESLPTKEYDDSFRLTIGSEQVMLYHVVGAHTDGDSFVWLPNANILHTGDILEMGAPPFIDLWAGGSLKGMIAGIDRAIAISNEKTTIVPGHGRVSTREDLRRYRAMLADLGTIISAAVTRGEKVDQVIAARPAKKYSDALGGEIGEARMVRRLHFGERLARARGELP